MKCHHGFNLYAVSLINPLHHHQMLIKALQSDLGDNRKIHGLCPSAA